MHKKLIITIGLIIALVGVGVVAYQQLAPAKIVRETENGQVRAGKTEAPELQIKAYISEGKKSIVLQKPGYKKIVLKSSDLRQRVIFKPWERSHFENIGARHGLNLHHFLQVKIRLL